MTTYLQRLKQLTVALCVSALSLSALADAVIDVHRDANCGCCKAWIKRLEAEGFTVNDHVETDMASVKTKLGVPVALGSCHTGVVDGKFIEGHVPASEIKALIARDDLTGAAVPRMPIGSPGMEMGDKRDAYQVIGLKADGETEVLARYDSLPAQDAHEQRDHTSHTDHHH